MGNDMSKLRELNGHQQSGSRRLNGHYQSGKKKIFDYTLYIPAYPLSGSWTIGDIVRFIVQSSYFNNVSNSNYHSIHGTGKCTLKIDLKEAYQVPTTEYFGAISGMTGYYSYMFNSYIAFSDGAGGYVSSRYLANGITASGTYTLTKTTSESGTPTTISIDIDILQNTDNTVIKLSNASDNAYIRETGLYFIHQLEMQTSGVLSNAVPVNYSLSF